jgi:Lrp/AsnC family leucine-responsive transcriptional regulator
MDGIDLAILKAVQEQGRLTLAALARQVGLSEAPVQRRLRALERSGWVDRYVALLSPQAVNRSTEVFVEVYLASESAANTSAFEHAVMAIPEVVECHRLIGDAQYLIKVVTRDIASFNDLYTETLLGLPGLLRTRRLPSMARTKYTTSLPLPTSVRDL